jgi:two-component system, LuxR family, response regulator FixJ
LVYTWLTQLTLLETAMVSPISVVVVDPDATRRNSVARFFYDNFRHVEPYESFEELRAFWPDAGIVMLHDDDDALRAMFDLMLERGCWLPVIAYADDPEPSRIVDVILMGAMDYLRWPTTNAELTRRLGLLATRKKSFAELRRRASHSQKLVENLTQREREVLFGISRGASNKSIAKELQISPRTIEIHRANMMGKLGVSHVGEAVSIALYAGFSNSAYDEESFDPFVVQQ